MEEILIRNGTVVSETGESRLDVRIAGSKIVETGKDLQSRASATILDATGKYVLPGAIDPHVHLDLQTPEGKSSDDFDSGTRAALAGGTTCIVDFVTPVRGRSIVEAVEMRLMEASKSHIDYIFHVSPVEVGPRTAEEMRKCMESYGIRSFKVYMAYRSSIGLKKADILAVMRTAGSLGGMVAIHCEADHVIESLRLRLAREGRLLPSDHPLSRPPEAESLAVQEAIAMATSACCPLYIVHVSSGQSLHYISRALKEGQAVYAETCPQYLLLDDSLYEEPFDRACAAVLSPPLRKKMDRTSLWEAIQAGVISTIGTDHCPFNLSQKQAGIHDFRRIPNGAGGVEHRLGLLHTYGVLKNIISMSDLVRLTATMPSRIFGLYPRKGIIRAGSDADICIWDPMYRSVISANTHVMRCDMDVYEGMEVVGRAETVISGGKVLVTAGRVMTGSGEGKFLGC
jgi:dihydropyrimidinase